MELQKVATSGQKSGPCGTQRVLSIQLFQKDLKRSITKYISAIKHFNPTPGACTSFLFRIQRSMVVSNAVLQPNITISLLYGNAVHEATAKISGSASDIISTQWTFFVCVATACFCFFWCRKVHATDFHERSKFKTGVSNTRPACGPQWRFVWPAMFSGNFQIIKMYVAKRLETRCREIIKPKLNDTVRCSSRP